MSAKVRGVSLPAVLLFASVVLAVLKIAGVIAWPWLAVLLPAIVGFALGVVAFVIVAALLGSAVHKARR